MTSGIYRIRNLVNGKIYIGQSVSIPKRWGGHRSELRGGYHYNAHLQRAWDKYGEEAFLFEVIEYCPVEKLVEREQFWLNSIRQFVDVFNCGKCADSPNRGRKLGPHSAMTKAKISTALKGKKRGPHSAKHRAKISAAHKGKKRTEEHRANSGAAHAKPYPAFIHMATGRIIPEGRNLAKLCREHPDGLDASRMRRVANGKYKHHRGWRLLENKGVEFPPPLRGKPYPALFNVESEEVIKGGVNFCKMCREHGLNYYAMLEILTGGPRMPYQGWILLSNKDVEVPSPPLGKSYPALYNELTGEKIEAGVNLKQMCREHGLSQANIWHVVFGDKLTPYKGWCLARALD